MAIMDLEKMEHQEYYKTKRGAPKKAQTKKAFSLRLSDDVIAVIRSKPNQQKYIEDLVRKNG